MIIETDKVMESRAAELICIMKKQRKETNYKKICDLIDEKHGKLPIYFRDKLLAKVFQALTDKS